jgi:hypothetical protein
VVLIKRMKRFELSTLYLARRCSTTDLHPRAGDADPMSMYHWGALGQRLERSKAISRRKGAVERQLHDW